MGGVNDGFNIDSHVGWLCDWECVGETAFPCDTKKDGLGTKTMGTKAEQYWGKSRVVEGRVGAGAVEMGSTAAARVSIPISSIPSPPAIVSTSPSPLQM